MNSSFEFDESILNKNIEIKGFNATNDKTIEELSELIQAIMKYRECIREQPAKEVFEKRRDNLIEEMADVYIVLENTKILYTISDEDVQWKIIDKQVRQAKRIRGDLPYVD